MTIVGSVNVDLVVRVAELPAPGSTVIGGTFERHPGGKGANQAVAAARLGAEVRFVGAVGDDSYGREAREALAAEGIEIGDISVLGGVATGVALIVVADDGENQIAVASGANARLDDAAVVRALRDRPADRGVYLVNREVADEAILAGARIAAAAGLPIVVVPAPALPLPEELLALRPILVPNRAEAEALTGLVDPVPAAEALADQTEQPVIVTLGRRGALLREPSGRSALIPAPKVDAVDATGAGDALAGALAVELARGRAMEPAVRFAVAAAAISVTKAGAREGMPGRADVERLVAAERISRAAR